VEANTCSKDVHQLESDESHSLNARSSRVRVGENGKIPRAHSQTWAHPKQHGGAGQQDHYVLEYWISVPNMGAIQRGSRPILRSDGCAVRFARCIASNHPSGKAVAHRKFDMCDFHIRVMCSCEVPRHICKVLPDQKRVVAQGEDADKSAQGSNSGPRSSLRGIFGLIPPPSAGTSLECDVGILQRARPNQSGTARFRIHERNGTRQHAGTSPSFH
jgi:hypothetical protein